jgi:hypothetical protein
MTTFATVRRRAGFALHAGLTAWAALILALAASGGAHATTVVDPAGDILPTFDPHGAHTTDNFADLDVVSASATYNSIDVVLTATMAGQIGSTDTGFYVWGVDTGTGVPFFQNLHNSDPSHQPDVGQGVIFDTFIVLHTDGTGAVNYFSGEPSEGLGAGAITIDGNTIRAVVPRSLLESTGFGIGQYGFDIWPRANGFNNGDVADFAPDHQNFSASATPEPAAWALMIAGFGLAGAALRRRRSLHSA